MGFVCYSYSRLQFTYICYDVKLHFYIHMLNLLDNKLYVLIYLLCLKVV